MSPWRVLGSVLLVVGLVLIVAPTLVHDPGPAANTFEAIERRIPWGGLAGLGALLIARTTLRPWRGTIASFAFWVTLGLLVARVAGLMLDGADDDKQYDADNEHLAPAKPKHADLSLFGSYAERRAQASLRVSASVVWLSVGSA